MRIANVAFEANGMASLARLALLHAKKTKGGEKGGGDLPPPPPNGESKPQPQPSRAARIRVCTGKSCKKAGAAALLSAFKAAAAANASAGIEVSSCSCRDACKASPCIELVTAGREHSLLKVRRIQRSAPSPRRPRPGSRAVRVSDPILLQRVRRGDVDSILAQLRGGAQSDETEDEQ
jgi:hypothetical protein